MLYRYDRPTEYELRYRRSMAAAEYEENGCGEMAKFGEDEGEDEDE